MAVAAFEKACMCVCVCGRDKLGKRAWERERQRGRVRSRRWLAEESRASAHWVTIGSARLLSGCRASTCDTRDSAVKTPSHSISEKRLLEKCQEKINSLCILDGIGPLISVPGNTRKSFAETTGRTGRLKLLSAHQL